ncbi:ribonuclease toxin immunity protein CdiI [Lysinibacillus sp. 3P01SB]|uniref:ribonuclease toxin immunity protein CdiI n=1 Tax=Lysinibacillus sp. 3P01SB TaxID=3132284 RepID=UPI0039A6D08B
MGKSRTAPDTNDEYYTAKFYLYSIPDITFLRVLENMSKGIGTSLDYLHCEFPGDIEEEEGPFEGVRFRVLDDNGIVLDEEEFYYLLKNTCKEYLMDFPQDRGTVQRLLNKVAYKLSLE